MSKLNRIEQIKELAIYAKENFPFYQQKYENIDLNEIKTLEDIKKLPIVSATELIENSEQLICKNKRPYRVTSSSGTSGKPKIIYRNKEDTDQSVKVLETMLRMAGVTENDTVLIGQPFDMAHFGYLVLGGCERINAISIPIGISMSNEKYISMILMYKPTVICSSMSRVLSIIDLLKEKNVNSTPYVKTIILAGEPLTSSGKIKIEEYFHTAPYNFYGSEETDGLASDCYLHNGLHFFEDLFYMELLELDGIESQIKENRIGEMVLTSLYQKGVPLIRYRLGDIVEVEKAQCSCGCKRPLIRVYGRAKDSFTIFDGITIMAYQIEDVLKAYFNNMINYQIVVSNTPMGKEEVNVRLEIKDASELFSEDKLIDALWDCTEDLQGIRDTDQLIFSVSINLGNIDVTQRGKTKKIIDLRKK